MGTFITTDGANAILDWALNDNSIYVALGSGSSSGLVSGGAFPEFSGNGYARQEVFQWNPVSGIAYPTSGVSFGPAGVTWNVISIALFNGPGSGAVPWWAGDLPVSASIGVADFGSFTTGALAVGFVASGLINPETVLSGNVLILGNLTVDGNISQI